MTDQTHTVPEREAELLLRLGKAIALLSDAAWNIANDLPDEAEELLEQLSDAECFTIGCPCVHGRLTAAEVARYKADRAKRRAGAS